MLKIVGLYIRDYIIGFLIYSILKTIIEELFLVIFNFYSQSIIALYLKEFLYNIVIYSILFVIIELILYIYDEIMFRRLKYNFEKYKERNKNEK